MSELAFSNNLKIRFGACLIVSYIVLSALMLLFGDYYIKLLLPFFSLAIDMISTELQVESISLGTQGSTQQILAVVINPEPLHFQTVSMPAKIPMQLSTLQGHVLQHIIIIYSLLLAYPPVFKADKLKLLLISIPFLLVVEFIDIPIVLLGSAYDLIYSNLATDLVKSSPLITMMNFLNGGGRLALSVAAAICSIGVLKLLRTFNYNHLLLLVFPNAPRTKI